MRIRMRMRVRETGKQIQREKYAEEKKKIR